MYTGYPKHLVAVDSIILSYDIEERELRLLLISRSYRPSKGKWSLPGGFVRKDESLDEAACRIMSSLTGLNDLYMEQLKAFGSVDRDPGGRVISVAYYSLIGKHEIDAEKQRCNEAHWRALSAIPELIFDHDIMVSAAREALRNRVKVQPVGFELLPEKFTLVQLQELYEAIYQRKIDRRNFRKKILSMNFLEKLDEKEKETSKKGAYYYRFNEEKYNAFSRDGFFFNLNSI